MKSVPISVRISEAEAEFIASLNLPGASTPSDKLRTIVSEARMRHEGSYDHSQVLRIEHDILSPVLSRRPSKTDRSVLVDVLANWLPEAVALTLDAGNAQGSDAQENEAELADYTIALIDRILRLGVTSTCLGHDPKVIRKRLAPILEIARLIDQTMADSQASSGEAGLSVSKPEES